MEGIDPSEACGPVIDNPRLARRPGYKIRMRDGHAGAIAQPKHKGLWGSITSISNQLRVHAITSLARLSQVRGAKSNNSVAEPTGGDNKERLVSNTNSNFQP